MACEQIWHLRNTRGAGLAVFKMTIDFTEQRTKMVDGQLRTTDVTNPALLDAMGTVPREAFVPANLKTLAYIDEDIVISSPASDQVRYLTEPSPFAKLVQLAEITPDSVVLDIGCGTGYSSAVLSMLAGSVIAIECDSELASSAASTLVDLGYDSVAVVEGALPAGYAAEAPYDAIILNGSVDEVPETLLGQLKTGGRLVAVLGEGSTGKATVWTRNDNGVSSRRAFNIAVPRLPGFQKEASFQF